MSAVTIGERILNGVFFPLRVICKHWPHWLRFSIAGLCFAFMILLAPIWNTNFLPIWHRNIWVRDCFVLVWFVLFYAVDGRKDILKLHWRKWVLIPAVAFCLYLIGNELLHPKEVESQGIVYLAVLLCGAVGSADVEARKRLWAAWRLGMKIAFFISAGFCFFCRPILLGSRYLGVYSNPNGLGIFALLASVMIIYDIDKDLGGDRICWAKVVGNLVLVGMANTFLYLSQARTSLLALAFAVCGWGMWRLLCTPERKKAVKVWGIAMLASVLASVACFPACYWTLMNVPDRYGKPLTFEGDIYKRKEETGSREGRNDCYTLSVSNRLPLLWEETVLETETEPQEEKTNFIEEWFSENGMLARIFTKTSDLGTFGGRKSVWEAYAAGLNWEGHESNFLTVETSGRVYAGAHNNFLMYGYMYGIPSMPLYGLLLAVMFAACIFYSKLESHGKEEGLLFFMFFLSFLAVTISEEQFTNIYHVMVLPFWLLAGTLSVKSFEKVLLEKGA